MSSTAPSDNISAIAKVGSGPGRRRRGASNTNSNGSPSTLSPFQLVNRNDAFSNNNNINNMNNSDSNSQFEFNNSNTNSQITSDPSYTPKGFLKPLYPGQGSHGLQEFWRFGDFDPNCSSVERRDHFLSGDAWPACLLRMKSFEDLHRLWFVCLKEKNFLMSERQAYKQHAGTKFRGAGRLKKVKLTMKRILTVLSRREIHQQALRAKEILRLQSLREIHETRRFHLLEQNKQLSKKIERIGNSNPDSISKMAWISTIEKNEEELNNTLQTILKPLRRSTMSLLTVDWRYSRKYTDLPGCKRWKKEWVRALDEHRRRPFRYY